MNKKKVLLAGNSEMVIFRFRKELVEQLVEEGHEVYVSFPQSQFGDGYTTAEKMGCHYIDTPISSHGTNPVTDLKLMQNYKKSSATDSSRYDVYLHNQTEHLRRHGCGQLRSSVCNECVWIGHSGRKSRPASVCNAYVISVGDT